MTHSKSWARRRAVQVLRIAFGPDSWRLKRMESDVEPAVFANQLGWILFGMCEREPNEILDAASDALLKISHMAGVTTEVRNA